MSFYIHPFGKVHMVVRDVEALKAFKDLVDANSIKAKSCLIFKIFL